VLCSVSIKLAVQKKRFSYNESKVVMWWGFSLRYEY
jgi:hypothetical protein